jgi:hypothetical protein
VNGTSLTLHSQADETSEHPVADETLALPETSVRPAAVLFMLAFSRIAEARPSWSEHVELRKLTKVSIRDFQRTARMRAE